MIVSQETNVCSLKVLEAEGLNSTVLSLSDLNASIWVSEEILNSTEIIVQGSDDGTLKVLETESLNSIVHWFGDFDRFISTTEESLSTTLVVLWEINDCACAHRRLRSEDWNDDWCWITPHLK